MATRYNYTLFFNGWAQCRLATDPDPDYEPRGVSGYTFALPGEPDLDRIIRFQDGPGVIPRSFGPEIGVRVTGGYYFKTKGTRGIVQFEERRPIKEDHLFYNAKIDLLNNPTFSSHNSILVYNGYGIVDPFDFQIKNSNGKDKIEIQRSFQIDPSKPKQSLDEISIDLLSPYIINIDATDTPALNNAESTNTPINRLNIWGAPNMLYESGILDPVAYRQQRLSNLENELATLLQQKTRNKVAVAALKKRISELKIDNPRNRRTAQLGAKVLLPYALNSKAASINGKTISPGPGWALEMWMGGWDADSLSFYVKGTVEISLARKPV